MRGDLDGGERACREALRCNPNYADAHSNLGAVLHKAGEGADSGAADGGWSQEELPASAAAVLIGDPVAAAAATAAAAAAAAAKTSARRRHRKKKNQDLRKLGKQKKIQKTSTKSMKN